MKQFTILDTNENVIESNITEEQVQQLMNRTESEDGFNYFMWPTEADSLNAMKVGEYSESIRFIKEVEGTPEEI